MTVWIEDMHVHIQWLVSVVEMVTVLEEYTTEEQSMVHCLWAIGLNSSDIRKEMFPPYGGKCCSHEVVHNWVEKSSPGHSKVADDA
jgi:hypothetical protein